MPPGTDTHTDYSCECGNFHLPMSAAGEPRTEAGRKLLADLAELNQPEKAKRRILGIEAEAARQTEPRLDVERLLSKLPHILPHVHEPGCGHNGEGITPQYHRGWKAGRAYENERIRTAIIAAYEAAASEEEGTP